MDHFAGQSEEELSILDHWLVQFLCQFRMSKSSECLQLCFEEFKNFKNMPEQLVEPRHSHMATNCHGKPKTPPNP